MNADQNSALHVTTVPVRWSDFDRYGHIMNANYVEVAQEARLQFAEDEFAARGHDFAVFVRHLDVDYLRPVLPDTTELLIETQVVEIGNTSFTTRQEIKDRQGRIACIVECVQVAIDMNTERPRSITKKEVKILTRADDVDELEAGDSAQ
ncbi:acyl-CoA thioesterase [Corynebacterium comes]|uniref:Long-chain acyl-CoA thioesterase FadM n=1 Tax=Corynebacterium comes TaxID=2675218 RepID=A0A6B8W1R8_9CORY|nr:thioesterase family protein [Corynebacterium comes]QGU05355.1 Long-chain acyl-CoA thioesterase FadM [Corynebacterium comes]